MAEPEEHPASKRRQIIHGAEVVFTECGYEGASMSRIALRAAVSKGTLYNYFTSKSDLFAAFVEQACASLIQVFEPVDQQEELDVTLNRIGQRMAELILSPESLVLFRIVVSEAGKFPHLAQIFWQTGPQQALVYMSDWLGQEMRAGRLQQSDPTFAAEQFFALCQTRFGMKRRLLLVTETSQEEINLVVEGAVRLFLNSYAAAAPGGPPRS